MKTLAAKTIGQKRIYTALFLSTLLHSVVLDRAEAGVNAWTSNGPLSAPINALAIEPPRSAAHEQRSAQPRADFDPESPHPILRSSPLSRGLGPYQANQTKSAVTESAAAKSAP